MKNNPCANLRVDKRPLNVDKIIEYVIYGKEGKEGAFRRWIKENK